MDCLNKIKIQKYIDKEMSNEEILLIGNHLKNCEKCRQSIEKQRIMAVKIKDALSVDGEVIIPEFKMPEKEDIRLRDNKSHTSARTIRRVAIPLAAAVILLFAILMIPNKNQVDLNDNQYVAFRLADDFDANIPLSQQDILISYVDSEGNIKTY